MTTGTANCQCHRKPHQANASPAAASLLGLQHNVIIPMRWKPSRAKGTTTNAHKSACGCEKLMKFD